MTAKQCFKCGAVKPTAEFYKHEQMGDGYLNKCKPCTRKDSRENRRARLEYYREYDRLRYLDPVRRMLSKESQAKRQPAAAGKSNSDWRKRNPEKYKAHTLVSSAVRSGRLTKEPCCVCGGPGHAHHEDYAKPLDVIWLCPTCHGAIHRLQRGV